MDSQKIIYLFIGFALGALLSGLIVSNRNQTLNPTPSASSVIDHSIGMTMTQMNDMLRDKTGDDFDKAFIQGMIEHHLGAIDMANQAKLNAKHDQIKKMADDIINAQTSEIEQMKTWQKDWDY